MNWLIVADRQLPAYASQGVVATRVDSLFDDVELIVDRVMEGTNS